MFRLFLLCLLIATPAFAQGTDWIWNVDRYKSKIEFETTQAGEKFVGKFTDFNCNIRFKPTDLEHSYAEVEIPMRSANTSSPSRDGELLGKNWLDVKTFPTAKFVSTTFYDKGNGIYEAWGSVTIRNITQPIVVRFKLDYSDVTMPAAESGEPPQIIGKQAHVRGIASLSRSVFGIGGAGTEGQDVGQTVKIRLDLIATRKLGNE